MRKADALLFCERSKIRKNFFYHRKQLDSVIARDCVKFTHFKQSSGHLRHALGLLFQQLQKIRSLRQDVGVLGSKQFDLRLHKRKRCAEFMRGISRKLTLSVKSFIKAVHHTVKGSFKMLKLRNDIFCDFHLC